jgi:mannose-6-phosphate isomerase-like protein (cupin superfamily)
VKNETAPIQPGDGIPFDMRQTRSFTQTGSEPLEMFSIGVARNIAAKERVAAVTSRKGGVNPPATRQ